MRREGAKSKCKAFVRLGLQVIKLSENNIHFLDRINQYKKTNITIPSVVPAGTA